MNCIGLQQNPFLMTISKITVKREKEIELKTFSKK